MYEEIKEARLKDPSVPEWAKEAIRAADRLDITDVMYTLRDLVRLFETSYQETTGREFEG